MPESLSPGAETVAIESPREGQVLYIPGADSRGALLLQYSVSIADEWAVRDSCAAGRLSFEVDGNLVMAEAAQLGRGTLSLSNLTPGQRTLSIYWLAETPSTQEDLDLEATMRGDNGQDEVVQVCARDSVEIWVIVAELQLVQRPWGGVIGLARFLWHVFS
jgi:hypothetical protein